MGGERVGDNERYINTCPNPESLSHQTIYEQLRGARPEYGRDMLQTALTQADGVVDDLARLTESLARLDQSWQAPSVQQGRLAIRHIKDYVEDARAHAAALTEGFGSYVDALSTAKARMPEPVDRAAGWWIPIVGPAAVIANDVQYQQRTAEARQLIADVYRAAIAADDATPGFDPPPVTTNPGGVPTTTPATRTPARSTAPPGSDASRAPVPS